MEEILSCEICTLDFCHETVIPKVLDCGHSFCLNCIKKIVNNGNSLCPNCTKKIHRKPENHPTLYAMLSLSDIYKNSPKIYDWHLFDKLQAMKKKYEARLKTLTDFSLQMNQALKLLSCGISRIEELKDDSGFDEKRFKHAYTLLQELERNYITIGMVLGVSRRDMEQSITIKLENFKDVDEFLYSVYKKLKNNEPIYSVHKKLEHLGYGKVSYQDDQILFHSLSLTELPENSSTILFDDLKQCVQINNFFTFLTMECNEKGLSQMVVIQMLNTEIMTNFVKLCTGECGPSYLEACCERDVQESDLYSCRARISLARENTLKNKYRLDYGVIEQTHVTIENDGDKFLVGENVEFLKIIEYKDIAEESVLMHYIGRVISPDFIDIKYSQRKLNIVDCGIIIKLD